MKSAVRVYEALIDSEQKARAHADAALAYADSISRLREVLAAAQYAEEADVAFLHKELSAAGELAMVETIVCTAFGISSDDLRRPSGRAPQAVAPRFTFCTLATTYTRASLGQIARAAGYADHTSVKHANDSLPRLCSTNPQLTGLVHTLEQRCRAAFAHPQVGRHLQAVS
jgi:chromosomal replication initiation ATPase DnaA